MNIVASHHAVQRWRERAAKYGDENITNIKEYLEQAIALQGCPPKGISIYKYNDIEFILHTNDSRTQVVTVIKEDKQEREPIVEKKKTQQQNKCRIQLIEPEIPELSSLTEVREWAKSEIKVCIRKIKNKEDVLRHKGLLIGLEKLLSSIKQSLPDKPFDTDKFIEKANRAIEKRLLGEWENWWNRVDNAPSSAKMETSKEESHEEVTTDRNSESLPT